MTEHVKLETLALDAGYQGRPVVSQAEFAVRSGEILVLLGPNGAGKSTVLGTIAGQLRPVGGTVLLRGRDLEQMLPADRARALSLLGTERTRGELMTCREAAAAGRYPYTGRLGILSGEDWEKVDRAMARMGAGSLAELPFAHISDGQRQRVLLARALCQEPEVLVLDEPASFLDVKYQLELVEALRSLAREGLAVILSLHELSLARRCGDRFLCLKDGRVARTGTWEEIRDHLEDLYDLPPGALGQAHYIRAEGKLLRCGYTTGTCAALAASGAAARLLTGIWPETAALVTPKGIRVEVALEALEAGADFARCGVRKDGGDDVDCTSGALICAEVRRSEEPGVQILGGPGVGRVTRPGLDQPIGAAAINSVPRRMITQAVEAAMMEADQPGGMAVTISVPEGEELAKKTFNPELGIVGGISILGTSGVVEPMSRQALVDTITLELRQRYAEGHRRLILTPGNYGMEALGQRGLDRAGVPVVKCSNFIGETVEAAATLGYGKILLVGHIGKLVKLAGGIFNTHSRQGDCRRELICAHCALAGGDGDLCRALMACATTEACAQLLRQRNMLEPVMDSLLGAIHRQLMSRAGDADIGVVLLSQTLGELGTAGDTDLWRKE